MDPIRTKRVWLGRRTPSIEGASSTLLQFNKVNQRLTRTMIGNHNIMNYWLANCENRCHLHSNTVSSLKRDVLIAHYCPNTKVFFVTIADFSHTDLEFLILSGVTLHDLEDKR